MTSRLDVVALLVVLDVQADRAAHRGAFALSMGDLIGWFGDDCFDASAAEQESMAA